MLYLELTEYYVRKNKESEVRCRGSHSSRLYNHYNRKHARFAKQACINFTNSLHLHRNIRTLSVYKTVASREYSNQLVKTLN